MVGQASLVHIFSSQSVDRSGDLSFCALAGLHHTESFICSTKQVLGIMMWACVYILSLLLLIPYLHHIIFAENFYGGDYSDITSTCESGWKDVNLKKTGRSSNKGMIPLSSRKACQNYVENKLPKGDNWHIEIAVPKVHNASLAESHIEESEGSSVTKTLERMSTDVTNPQDIGYEYVPMDDKQECSSVSNLTTDNFETKFVTVSHDCLEDGGSVKPIRRTQQFAAEEIIDEPMYSSKMRDRRSLDSTVTESCSQTAHGCCSQMANEMVCIRKQLLEIENKQSNLMDLLQVK